MVVVFMVVGMISFLEAAVVVDVVILVIDTVIAFFISMALDGVVLDNVIVSVTAVVVGKMDVVVLSSGNDVDPK